MQLEEVVPLKTKVADEKIMNHSIDIYHFPLSPPSRAVVLLAQALGLNFNKKIVDLTKGEHMKPEYLKINPAHTIPAINDNGFVLWESHAILKYLVDQYGKDNKFFSQDPKISAIIFNRLFFEGTVLFPTLTAYCVPVLFEGHQPDPNGAAKFEEKLQILDGLIKNDDWIAGKNMTIADFSVVSIISTAEAINFNIQKYQNVFNWFKRAKASMANFGYEELNQSGATAFGAAFRSKLK